MTTKNTKKKKASKTTTLRPYVYSDGKVKLFDAEKYAKAVARSRSATGGAKEQAKRRKNSKERIDKAILAALSRGERVNLSYLQRSGPVPGATERRIFLIEGGRSRSRLAKWLGEPKGENVKRFQRRLQVFARVTETGEPVSFNVEPNPSLRWAGEVGRWIEQTAILLLEAKPKRQTTRKRKSGQGPVPERRSPSDDTQGESSGTAGRRSDAIMEPKPSEKRPVLILEVSVMSDKKPTEREIDFETDDRKRKGSSRRRKP
jgi:hypothetical protein